MSHVVQNRRTTFVRHGALAALLALAISCVSCGKSGKPAVVEITQKTFGSPDEAGKALLEAVKSGDQDSVLAIFGPGSKDTIYSGDATEDKKSFENFATAYGVMNRWRKADDTEILLVGADNQAFPIPLTKNDVGQWYFNTPMGKQEIFARRIGRNELAAIDVCAALADAQVDYFSQHHDGANVSQYAQKFISDDGKQNGMYWKSPEGQPRSPLGPLVVFATEEGYKVQQSSHQPFHGYYFGMLYKQGSQAKGRAKDYVVNGKMTGGFAFVAYPSEYGQSGVATFIINQDHVLYEKDLGPTTKETAAHMSEFNPDSGWKQVGG